MIRIKDSFKQFHIPADVSKWVAYYSNENSCPASIDWYRDSPLAEYKGGGYRAMNECLRTGKISCERDNIEGLQMHLLKCPLPESITVHRFVSWCELLTIYINTCFRREYVHPCFLSTTMLKEYYSMESIKANRIVIRINIVKGTCGICLPEVNPAKPEYEVLLAHHCKLKRRKLFEYTIEP